MHRRKALAIAVASALTLGAASIAAAANAGLLSRADDSPVGDLNATNVSDLVDVPATPGQRVRVEIVEDPPVPGEELPVDDAGAPVEVGDVESFGDDQGGSFAPTDVPDSYASTPAPAADTAPPTPYVDDDEYEYEDDDDQYEDHEDEYEDEHEDEVEGPDDDD